MDVRSIDFGGENNKNNTKSALNEEKINFEKEKLSKTVSKLHAVCNEDEHDHVENESQINDENDTPLNIGRMQVFVCKVCSHEWVSTKKKVNTSYKNETVISTPSRCPSCRSTLWNRDDLSKFQCLRCDYKWVSTAKMPYKCPKCFSARWNTPLEMCKCRMCGYTWERKRKSLPSKCPSCNSSYWNKDSRMHMCASCGTEYVAKVNKCNRCPNCNIRFYSCKCNICGHVWNDNSGNRPQKCTGCGSTQWQHKENRTSKKKAIPEEVPKAIDVNDLLRTLDMKPDYAQVLVLLSQGKKPLEVAMITEKSYDSVIQARNKFISLLSGEKGLVS